MKVFLVLLFVGCVTASFQGAFEKASDDAVQNFREGVERVQTLQLELDVENNEASQRYERSLKDEMMKRLKEAFETILKKIDDEMKKGKEINQDALNMLKQLKDDMDEIDIEDHEIEAFELKVNDHLKQILEKMGILDQQSAGAPMQSVFDESSLRNFFNKVKKMIIENFDADKLKSLVEKYFGKGSEIAEQFISMLKEKGEKKKQEILDWIDRVLPDKEERSIKEVYEKIKNYFKDLNIELKEKFAKFGEYVKEKYGEGLEKGKSRLENIREIAQKFIDDSREGVRNVAEEALIFLRPYKEDLGLLYEKVKEKVRDLIKKE